jgi:hypothetical protein
MPEGERALAQKLADAIPNESKVAALESETALESGRSDST